MKTCTKCKKEKPLSSFHKSKAHKDGRNPQCADCYNEARRKNADPELQNKRSKEWYENNKERVRENQMMKKYGVTVEQFNEMVSHQNNQCEICSKVMDGPREPAIDHCHSTGEVRGLLCINCNVAIGHMNDDTERLMNAIKYLEKYSGNK